MQIRLMVREIRGLSNRRERQNEPKLGGLQEGRAEERQRAGEGGSWAGSGGRRGGSAEKRIK